MQSGISASTELRTSFTHFLTTPTSFALLVNITSERLTPLSTISSSSPIATPSDFYTSLPLLTPHLTPTTPLYILLRRHPPTSPTSPEFVAVTYVPDTAPVRQKMLFASTRLTLVRELGPEKFHASYFATEKRDLEREGWEKWERTDGAGAPLTEGEEVLRGVKEQEEIEGGRGTGERKLVGGGGVKLGVGADVMETLAGLKSAQLDNLVMLVCFFCLVYDEGYEVVVESVGRRAEEICNADLAKRIDVATETIELAGTSSTDAAGLATEISDQEPRYSFFRYSEGGEEALIVFIYTCPSVSKIKERMLYATSKLTFVQAVEAEAGLNVVKRLEASNPSEISAAALEEEFRPKQEQKQGFSRPKRPGKR